MNVLWFNYNMNAGQSLQWAVVPMEEDNIMCNTCCHMKKLCVFPMQRTYVFDARNAYGLFTQTKLNKYFF